MVVDGHQQRGVSQLPCPADDRGVNTGHPGQGADVAADDADDGQEHSAHQQAVGCLELLVDVIILTE
ncbi:hypothetical protein [Streptomyces sp. NBC_00467]|uniref:hypothetical protein n=1 Tax=Streptomyces sp. NBC_00467 TaxID=2975752 RepID=UPI002E196846